MHGGGGILGRAPSPHHSLCLPGGPANFCPKNRSPPSAFFIETEDRSSERDQIAKDLRWRPLFFWSSPSTLRAKSIPKKNNIGFGANCWGIPKASRLRKGFPKSFFAPFLPPPETVLFYLQCTNCTLVCDQIENKSSSFVLLNASILRKYRGKPSLRFARFQQFIEL